MICFVIIKLKVPAAKKATEQCQKKYSTPLYNRDLVSLVVGRQ